MKKVFVLGDSISIHYGPFLEAYNEDLIRYNEIAAKVMAAKEIPVIDLYRFTNNLKMPLHEDHVHFYEAIRKLQAAYITGSLMALEQSGRL